MRNSLHRWRRRPLLEQIEPRLLHSADAAPVVVIDEAAGAVVQLIQVAPAAPAQAAAVQSADAQAGALARELVVIDGRVPDADRLLADLQAQRDAGRAVDVLLVGADEDGIAAVGAALAAAQFPYDAVHLVSHGESGAITLGATRLDTATLRGAAPQVAAWANGLAERADLLVYGCDVSAGSDGERFIADLATLTGADVAASDDATGSVLAGGDWLLERQTGAIEHGIVFSIALQGSWNHTLEATVTSDVTVVTQTGNQSLPAASGGRQLASNGSGASAMVWQLDDGPVSSIQLRMFDASGTLIVQQEVQNAQPQDKVTVTAGQGMPSVAVDANGNVAVVFTGSDGDGNGVFIAVYDSGGNVQRQGGREVNRVGTTADLVGATPAPAVAAVGNNTGNGTGNNNDNRFAVTWTSQGGDLMLASYDDQAKGKLDAHVIATPGAGGTVTSSAVAGWAGQTLVSYAVTDVGGQRSVQALRIGSVLTNSSFEALVLASQMVDAGSASIGYYAPDVAVATDGSWAISYTVQDITGDTGIRVRFYANDLVLLGTAVNAETSTLGNQDNSSIAFLSDGNALVTWQSPLVQAQGDGILAQRLARDGTRVDSAFVASTGAVAGNQRNGSVAITGHTATLLYQDDAGVPGIVVRQASISLGDGRLTGDGGLSNQQVSTPGATDRQWLSDTSSGRQVASNAAGTTVVVWEEVSGMTHQIYARRFDASGNALGAARVDVGTVSNWAGVDSVNPSVAIDDGGAFVVVWNGWDGGEEGVYAAFFDAAGAEVGPSGGTVVSTTPGADIEPAVAAIGWHTGNAADNRYVISWTDSDDYISFSTFDLSGNLQTYNGNVTTTIGGNWPLNACANSAVAGANGAVVITYEGSDAVGTGVYAWLMPAASSTPVDIEVSAPSAFGSTQPDVAMAANGMFAISYTSPENPGTAIRVSAYASDGSTPWGGAHLVHASSGVPDQTVSSIAWAHGGATPGPSDPWSIAVAWQEFDADNASDGIFVQRIDNNGALLGTRFTANMAGGVLGSQAVPSIAISQGTNGNVARLLYEDTGENQIRLVSLPLYAAGTLPSTGNLQATIAENGSLSQPVTLTLPGVQPSDQIWVRIEATQGTVHVGGNPVFETGHGNDTASVWMTGTLADLGTALAALMYTPTADYNGLATIRILAGDGVGADLPTDVTVTVQARNDLASINGATSGTLNAATIAESADDMLWTVLSGGTTAITVTDVDLDTLLNADVGLRPLNASPDTNSRDWFTLTVVASAPPGAPVPSLAFGGLSPADQVRVVRPAGPTDLHSIQYSGTRSEIDAALAGLQLGVAAHFNGDITLDFTVEDYTNGANGVAGTATTQTTMTVSVTPVNDPASFVNQVSGAYVRADLAEVEADTTWAVRNGSGSVIAIDDFDLSPSLNHDADLRPVTLLQDTSNRDFFTLTVVASADNDTVAGTLSFASMGTDLDARVTTSQGGRQVSLSGTKDEINVALAALQHTRAANANGDVTLTFTVDDHSNGSDTSSASSTASATLLLHVAAVNDLVRFNATSGADVVLPASEFGETGTWNVRSGQAFGTSGGTVVSVADIDLDGTLNRDADLGTGAERDVFQITVSISVPGGTTPTLGFSSLPAIAPLNQSGNFVPASSLVMTGTLAQINDALSKLQVRSGNYNGLASLTFQIDDRSNGDATSGAQSLARATLALDIHATNDQASWADTTSNAYTASSIAEDASNWLVRANQTGGTGGVLVRFTDPADRDPALNRDPTANANQDRYLVTATASTGTLAFQSLSGLNLTTSTSNGGRTVSVTGAFANVNTALSRLLYTPPADFNGAATLTFVVNDFTLGTRPTDLPPGANNSTRTATLQVNVAAANDRVIVSIPSAPVPVDEDTTLTIRSQMLSIADTTDTTSSLGRVKVTLETSDGSLALNSTALDLIQRAGSTSFGFVDGTSGSGSRIVFNARIFEAKALLAGMTFVPTTNMVGDASFTIEVYDAGSVSLGTTPQTTTETFLIFVDAVNDAPIISAPGAASTQEDTPYRMTGTGAFRVAENDLLPGGASSDVVPVSVTLESDLGTLALGSAAGLTFNGDSTSKTIRFTGTVAAVNAALEGLTFSPDANVYGDATIRLTVNDLGNTGKVAKTGAPGALEESSTTTVRIVSINDAPTIATNTGVTMRGGTTVTVTPAMLAANEVDPEHGPSLQRFTLTSAPQGGDLMLDGAVLSDGDSFTQADIDRGAVTYSQRTAGVVTDRLVLHLTDPLGTGPSGVTFTMTMDPPLQLPQSTNRAVDTGSASSSSSGSSSTTTQGTATTATPASSDSSSASGNGNAAATGTARGGGNTTATTASGAAPGFVAAGAETATRAISQAAVAALSANAGAAAAAAADAVASAGGGAAGDHRSVGFGQPGSLTGSWRGATGSDSLFNSAQQWQQRLMQSEQAAVVERVAVQTTRELARADFRQQLQRVREEIGEQVTLDKTLVASSVAVSAGVSIGYVVWLLRGGLLLSSLLASVPAWRMIDPLPVLAGPGAGEGGEDDSLQGMLKKASARLRGSVGNADEPNALHTEFGDIGADVPELSERIDAPHHAHAAAPAARAHGVHS